LTQNNRLKLSVEMPQGRSTALPQLQNVVYGNYLVAALVKGFGNGVANPDRAKLVKPLTNQDLWLIVINVKAVLPEQGQDRGSS
jgi:hypothetical protein